jgi:hypothetical protein
MPQAFAYAAKGDWSLMQAILGYEFVQRLRDGTADEEVIRYVARAYGYAPQYAAEPPAALPPPE